ncbi:MAG: Rrf2 family transcriptional regulator [Salinivirgaceae bacterium]|nr:Rrf2 family transcriptional regulator [Salinivirgaceae bacterium]
MMISTRGRYAIRVMIDLAEQGSAGYTRLKDISERQDISLKYLESITTSLSKAGLIDGVHGKGGGYRLNRPALEYHLTEILHATEGSLAPVACLGCDAKPCERTQICRTLPMWKKLYETVNNFFDNYTIADLMKNSQDFEYLSAEL